MKNSKANVVVVTHCNRKCPRCCMSDMVRGQPPHFVDPDVVFRDVEALGDVGEVIITGGEATLHPEFLAVAECARIARGDRLLSLFTNGAMVLRHQKALQFFDQIYMSVYSSTSNAGTPTDWGLIKKIRAACSQKVKLKLWHMIHKVGVGGHRPCVRLFDTVSVLEGRVYSCCVANGIAGAQSTELGPGWAKRLLRVPAPCERCVFSK